MTLSSCSSFSSSVVFADNWVSKSWALLSSSLISFSADDWKKISKERKLVTLRFSLSSMLFCRWICVSCSISNSLNKLWILKSLIILSSLNFLLDLARSQSNSGSGSLLVSDWNPSKSLVICGSNLSPIFIACESDLSMLTI